jgi:outer membrane protein
MELLEISEEDLKNQEKQLNQITEMVKAGSLARVDQYNQEAIVKAAELTKLRAKIRLRGDKAILSQTLGREPDLQFELVKPTWDLNRNNLSDQPIDQLYIQALGSRGDLLRAQKNVESTKKGKAISKTAFIPTVSAYGSLNSRYSNASLTEFNDQIDANQRKEYGLRLSVPIFSGMRNNSNYVQSKVNHSNAQLDLANQEIIVKSDVLNAYQNYQDASVNFDASEAQLDAAQLSFNLELERYKLGISDFVASNQANQRFVQARGDLAQATYTLMFQDILLQYATGTLKIEDIQ